MNHKSLDPMNRQPYTYDTPMRRSLDRTRELYPEDHNFNLSGAIGNEKQYSEHVEWK